MDKGGTVIDLGAIEVAMRYRDDIPGDAGVCLQVYATVDGAETELLRFDCFANAPHYHYGPAGRDERLLFDATAGGDPLAWTLGRFAEGRLPAMIERAGYPSVAEAVDGTAVAGALASIEEAARGLEAAGAAPG